MKSTEIIYVGDPMCSWCWGAAMEITQLKNHHQDNFAFRVLLGGLRPGTLHPWKASQRQFLKKHWEEIAHMTGQPFGYEILNKEDFIYDTEIPCRAVFVCRQINPDQEFGFFKAIQYAFYAQNKDSNQLDTYLEICESNGMDPVQFQSFFEDPAIKDATAEEFEQSRSLGVMGFPTLLVRQGAYYRPLSRGYATFAQMNQNLDVQLKKLAEKNGN